MSEEAVRYLERNLDGSTATFMARACASTGLALIRANGFRESSNVTRSMFSIIRCNNPDPKHFAHAVGCPVCLDVQYPGRRCPEHDADAGPGLTTRRRNEMTGRPHVRL